jgi:hypothetical protein
MAGCVAPEDHSGEIGEIRFCKLDNSPRQWDCFHPARNKLRLIQSLEDFWTVSA